MSPLRTDETGSDVVLTPRLISSNLTSLSSLLLPNGTGMARTNLLLNWKLTNLTSLTSCTLTSDNGTRSSKLVCRSVLLRIGLDKEVDGIARV